MRQKLYRVVEEFAVKQGWSSVTKTRDPGVTKNVLPTGGSYGKYPPF